MVKTILPFSRGHFRSTFSIWSHRSIVCFTKVITPHLTSTFTTAPSSMVSWKVPEAVMVRVSPLGRKKRLAWKHSGAVSTQSLFLTHGRGGLGDKSTESMVRRWVDGVSQYSSGLSPPTGFLRWSLFTPIGACEGSKREGKEAAATSGEARSRAVADKNFMIAIVVVVVAASVYFVASEDLAT